MQAGRAVCVWMFLIRLSGCGYARAPACISPTSFQENTCTGTRPACGYGLSLQALHVCPKPFKLPCKTVMATHAARHWTQGDC